MRQSLIEKGKPGDFRATCRKARWEPLADVLALPRDQQPDTAHTRWDSKLKCEVVVVRCNFDTTDRAAFETHMREVHGKRPRGPRQLKRGTGHWRGPRLHEDGQPLKPSTKDIAESVRTCVTCGLVAEVRRGVHADELWWTEHERGCAIAAEQRFAS